MTAVGLFGGVSPALAEGVGVSSGYSNVNVKGTIVPGQVPCLQASLASIDLTNVGAVGTVQTSPPAAAEFAGIWTAHLPVANHYFNPAGVFAASNCIGAPGLIPLTGATITGTTTAGGVTTTVGCTGAAAGSSYTRVANVYTIVLNTTCTVTAGALSATQAVTFVFTGNQTPCLDDFGIPDCQEVTVPTPVNATVSTELNGVYSES